MYRYTVLKETFLKSFLIFRKFAAKVLLFFELCKYLSDFFAYFDAFGSNMRSTAGFEEKDHIAAAEEEFA